MMQRRKSSFGAKYPRISTQNVPMIPEFLFVLFETVLLLTMFEFVCGGTDGNSRYSTQFMRPSDDATVYFGSSTKSVRSKAQKLSWSSRKMTAFSHRQKGGRGTQSSTKDSAWQRMKVWNPNNQMSYIQPLILQVRGGHDKKHDVGKDDVLPIKEGQTNKDAEANDDEKQDVSHDSTQEEKLDNKFKVDGPSTTTIKLDGSDDYDVVVETLVQLHASVDSIEDSDDDDEEWKNALSGLEENNNDTFEENIVDNENYVEEENDNFNTVAADPREHSFNDKYHQGFLAQQNSQEDKNLLSGVNEHSSVSPQPGDIDYKSDEIDDTLIERTVVTQTTTTTTTTYTFVETSDLDNTDNTVVESDAAAWSAEPEDDDDDDDVVDEDIDVEDNPNSSSMSDKKYENKTSPRDNGLQIISLEPYEEEDKNEILLATTFTSDMVSDNLYLDDDSSAFVDRMELADAYEDETTLDTVRNDHESETSSTGNTTSAVSFQTEEDTHEAEFASTNNKSEQHNEETGEHDQLLKMYDGNEDKDNIDHTETQDMQNNNLEDESEGSRSHFENDKAAEYLQKISNKHDESSGLKLAEFDCLDDLDEDSNNEVVDDDLANFDLLKNNNDKDAQYSKNDDSIVKLVNSDFVNENEDENEYNTGNGGHDDGPTKVNNEKDENNDKERDFDNKESIDKPANFDHSDDDEQEDGDYLENGGDTDDEEYASSSNNIQYHLTKSADSSTLADDAISPSIMAAAEAAERRSESVTIPTIRTSIAHGGSVAPPINNNDDDDNDDDEDGSSKFSIVVPSEITPEMRNILLKELKFRPDEVSVMRPDIAAVVVEKRLSRPLEGLPQNWYQAGKQRPQLATFARIKKSVVVVIAALMVVKVVTSVPNGKGVPPIELGSFDVVSRVRRLSLGKKSSTPVREDTKPVFVKEDFSTNLPVNKQIESTSVDEHVNEPKEHHFHSIRPHEEPPSDDDMDFSLLDKIITRVQKTFRAIFRAKL